MSREIAQITTKRTLGLRESWFIEPTLKVARQAT